MPLEQIVSFDLEISKDTAPDHVRSERSYNKWQCNVPWGNVVDESRGESRGYDTETKVSRGAEVIKVNNIETDG